MLWSPVSRWCTKVVVSSSSIRIRFNVLRNQIFFAFLSLTRTMIRCCTLYCVFSSTAIRGTAFIFQRRLIKDARHHSILLCIASLEIGQLASIDTLFHLGHCTLLSNHALVCNLLIEHLFVVYLAVLLKLLDIGFNDLPHLCLLYVLLHFRLWLNGPVWHID